MLLGDKAKEVVYRFKTGQITYDQCRAELQPIVDEMNEKAREIAKKFGKKHHNFNITSLMR